MPIGRNSELNARLGVTNAASPEIRKVSDELAELRRRGDVTSTLKANDQASSTLKSVDQLVTGLDGSVAEAKAVLNDQASGEIRTISGRLQALGDEDVMVVLQARADQLEREVDKSLTALRNIHKMSDTEVQIRLIARDNASRELESVKSEMDTINRARAEVTLEARDNASGDIDRVQGELRELDGSTARVRIDASGFQDVAQSLKSGSVDAGSIGDLLGAGGPVAGGVLAIGGGLLAAANHSADLAIGAKTTADLTGASVEEASRLQSVWKLSGADVNDLNDVLLQMNGVLLDSPEIAAQLGINLRDGKDIGERFVEVVGRIDQSTLGAADKAKLMSAAFGEEGVRQVQTLLTLIGGDLQGALDEVSETQVFDEGDVEKARRVKEQFSELETTMQNWAVAVGEAVIPAIDWIGDKFTWMGDRIQDAEDLLDTGLSKIGIGESPGEKRMQAFWTDIAAASKEGAGAVEVAAGSIGTSTSQTEEAIGVLAMAGVEHMRSLAEEFAETVRGAQEFDDAMSSSDWGRASLDGALTAMSSFSTDNNALRQIASDAEDAWLGLGVTLLEEVDGKLRKLPLTLDATTEAGRRQIDAVAALATSVDTELAVAYANAEGDQTRFMDSAREISDSTLKRLQEELGLSAEEVDLMRESLGLTATDWEARFKLAGTEEARIKIGLLQGSIDGLPDDVEKRVNQKIITGDYQGALAEIQGFYDNPRNQARAGVDADANPRSMWDTLNFFRETAARNPTRAPVNADANQGSTWNTLAYLRDVFSRNPSRAPVDPDANQSSTWNTLGYLRDVFSRNPARLPVNADANNVWGAWNYMQSVFNNNPLSVAVNAVGALGGSYYASGGIAGPSGVAGENFRPEILNDRVVINRPTALSPGTKVTGEAETQMRLARDGAGGGGTYNDYRTITFNAPAGMTIADMRQYARVNGYSDPFA